MRWRNWSAKPIHGLPRRTLFYRNLVFEIFFSGSLAIHYFLSTTIYHTYWTCTTSSQNAFPQPLLREPWSRSLVPSTTVDWINTGLKSLSRYRLQSVTRRKYLFQLGGCLGHRHWYAIKTGRTAECHNGKSTYTKQRLCTMLGGEQKKEKGESGCGDFCRLSSFQIQFLMRSVNFWPSDVRT